MSLSNLPLILAGPILRRVEPTQVCVWVALKEPRALVLAVYEGRRNADTDATPFEGPDVDARGAANTLRVGDHLHIGVVCANVPASQALVPGINYSYNLGFAPLAAGFPQGATLPAGSVNPTQDLLSLGLLVEENTPGKDRNLPLGYAPGELPGFALPPPDLENLRLLHGSCRRPGFVYGPGQGKNSFDGLAWVDDLIDRWRRGTVTEEAFDANVRPHQLFLTGDQIYADDVSSIWLPMLNRIANQLIGVPEHVPTRYPPDNTPTAKEQFLGAPKQPGSTDLQDFINDAITDKKDPLEELKDDRRVRALADPCFDRHFQLLYEENFSLDPNLKTVPGNPPLRLWPVDLLHFPAGLRGAVIECEAKFSSADRASHLISFGEYCAMYLAVFSNAVWDIKPDSGSPRLATVAELFTLPAGDLPQIWDLHSCYEDLAKCIAGKVRDRAAAQTPARVLRENRQCLGRKQRAALDDCLEKNKRTKDRVVRGVENANDSLTSFFQSLPRVRRALANIPTYMIFDDHDVTDDWNLSRAWRDRVHTSPLGRRILTVALSAYAVFQDWGNDPKRYLEGQPRRMLEQIAALFPVGAVNAPPASATDELEKMFALNQVDPETPPDPSKPDPAIRWHFSIDGPRHRVIALDTRTRRVFRSRYLPPGLLSQPAIKAQIPDPSENPLPAGVDVLIVISQTPILLPSLASSVILPLSSRIHEFKHRTTERNLPGLEPDNEIWPGDDLAFEAVLEALAKYERVVVLSGEVHYGYSAQMSIWKKPTKRFTLAAARQADLDRGELNAALTGAFAAAGFPLSGLSSLTVREDNDEWLVTDLTGGKVYLVRKEPTGLNVYEEQGPARIAQFVSSGLKNVKQMIADIGRGAGFAYALIDLTPAERLIWNNKLPAPLTIPPDAHLTPAVRDRLGSEPVLLPSRRWPAGVRVKTQPDTAWRIDMVRDERPEAERPEFTRLGPPPDFDHNDIHESYRAIARRHTIGLQKMRFARGVAYTINLGLVRFEVVNQVITACHDLYTHPPEKHEAALLNVHRVPLQLFSDQRPQLRFQADFEADRETP